MWEERLPLLRKEIETGAFDILFVQEALRATLEGVVWDQAEILAEGLGFHVHRASHTAADFPLGNAILSKFPFEKTYVWELPDAGSEQRRTLVGAVLRAPKVEIPVFCTHLNWRLDEGDVRMEQIRFVDEKVRTLATPGRYPALLAGDLNADPDSDEIRFLRGLTSIGGKRTFYNDVWNYIRPADFGGTFVRANPYAAVCREADRRIDYLFVKGPDDSGLGEPLAASLCFDRPENGVFPSDHFGVRADLRM